jgi:hypothetical protein
MEKNEAQTTRSYSPARTTLRESIRTARELRTANLALTEQITHSIRVLTERCELLTVQSLQDFSLGERAKPAESQATD